MSSFGKDKLDSCLFGYMKAKYQVLYLSELKQTHTENISVKSDETVKYDNYSFKYPKILNEFRKILNFGEIYIRVNGKT